MKKYYLLLLFFIMIPVASLLFVMKVNSEISDEEAKYLAHYLNTEEINYCINNKIPVEELKPYLPYSNFNIYNFYEYRKLQEQYQYSPLEAINHQRHPNYYKFYDDQKPAIYPNTSKMLVNKNFYLNKDFTPTDLVNINDFQLDFIEREGENILIKKIVLDNYLKMINDAKNKDIYLTIFSGYRSYEKQQHLFFYVNNEDDSISARPGLSEHQTGYAIDISLRSIGLTNEFEDTKAYEWLIENSFKYGFILRFPSNKTNKTGYLFEPWHYRYVGEIASDIYYQKLTLEEYIIKYYEI